MLEIHESATVGELEHDAGFRDAALVTADWEVEHVLAGIGRSDVDAGCLFVETADGEYGRVWALSGSVPWMTAQAVRIR